ncbi:MAG: transposase [Chloroflexi bacterium]|nr:transposase [Chloroflexota bacterium]
MSKARVRFGLEVFEGFFGRSIELCREAGLLSEGPVYVDSTLVRAAASMDSLVERGDGVNPPYSVTEYVRRLYEENTSAAQEADSPVASPPSTYEEPDAKVPPRYRKKSRPDGHRRKANSELVSRTDPEATVISRRGFDMHLAYKAHMAVAGKKGQIVTAAVATTGAKADEHVLGEVLWHHRRLSHLPIQDIVADTKYGTMTNYLYLHQAGMRAFIPSRHHKRGPGGVWGRDQFRYLPDEDVYVCPALKRMTRFTRRPSTQRIGYRVEKGTCESCSFRQRCSPSGGERTISRFFDHQLIDEAEERVAGVLGRRLLHERQVRSEGAFALAKELHGLRRTRFVGRRKVQIQLWLTAAAMNIKKAAKAMRPLPAAAAVARTAVPGRPFSNPVDSLILAGATTLLRLGRAVSNSVHKSLRQQAQHNWDRLLMERMG